MKLISSLFLLGTVASGVNGFVVRSPVQTTRSISRQQDLISLAAAEERAVQEAAEMTTTTTNEKEGEMKTSSDNFFAAATESMKEVESTETEELSESQKLLKQVKEAGTAGFISYAIWEMGFWALSVPVCIFGYRELTG